MEHSPAILWNELGHVKRAATADKTGPDSVDPCPQRTRRLGNRTNAMRQTHMAKETIFCDRCMPLPEHLLDVFKAEQIENIGGHEPVERPPIRGEIEGPPLKCTLDRAAIGASRSRARRTIVLLMSIPT